MLPVSDRSEDAMDILDVPLNGIPAIVLEFCNAVAVAALPDIEPVALPMFGVVKTGDIEKTALPVPVSSDIRLSNCRDVVEDSDDRLLVVVTTVASALGNVYVCSDVGPVIANTPSPVSVQE